MSKHIVKAQSNASRRELIFVLDSSSTTGAGKTGIAHNASGLKAYYYRPGDSTASQISLKNIALGDAFDAGGWVEVDPTNMPGVYRIDIPDGAFTSVVNKDKTVVVISGAANMAPVTLEYTLVAYDPNNGTSLGLSNIDTNIGSRMATFTLPSNFDLLSINGSGQVVASSVIGNVAGSVGSVTGNVGGNVVGSVASVTGNVSGSVNSVVTGVTLANNSVNADSVSDVAAQEIANAVWTANIAQTYSIGGVPAANWANNTFGDRVVISDSNNQNEVAITGSNHIAADIHEIQPDEIIDIAQGVLTEATSTTTYAVGDVGNILGRLVNMVEADGADFRYTTNALEQAPSGGGGGGSTTNIHMGPFVVKADGEESDIPLDIQKNAAHDIDIQLTDIHGTGVSLAGATTSVKVYNTGGTLVATYSGTATYSADGRLTFAITTAVTANAGTYTATVTRTTGASDTQVFGPLRIYVRDI